MTVTVEVPVPPAATVRVVAANVKLFVAAVREQVDTRVLEKTSDDTGDSNVFAHAGHARPKATHAANDQCNRDTGSRRRIQLFNQGRVRQAVELCENAGGTAGQVVIHFSFDPGAQKLAELDRRNDHFHGLDSDVYSRSDLYRSCAKCADHV